jgi:hypothetical protein
MQQTDTSGQLDSWAGRSARQLARYSQLSQAGKKKHASALVIPSLNSWETDLSDDLEGELLHGVNLPMLLLL